MIYSSTTRDLKEKKKKAQAHTMGERRGSREVFFIFPGLVLIAPQKKGREVRGGAGQVVIQDSQ